MKNKILSFTGRGLAGCSTNIPEITRKSPGNHAVITRFWKVITMVVFLFTFAIGNVWGEDVTFTAADIADGKTKGNIEALTSDYSTSNSKICTSSNVALVQLSGQADATYADNTKRLAFRVKNNAGTITAIRIHGSTNSSSGQANGPVIFWDDTDFPATAIGYQDVSFKGYVQTNSCDNHYYDVTPSEGTTAFAIYKRVKFNTTTKALGGSESNYGGNTTLRIDEVVITIESSCTKPGTPGTPSVSSKTHNSANLTWTAAAHSNGHMVSIVKKSDASVIVDWTECATNSYSASGLSPETTYTFKVKAKGESGYCDLGDEASADFATEVDPSATKYKVTLVPAGGTISDATGWTLNAGNYEKEVSSGTELTLPTFTKANRTFKTWRKAGPTDVTSPITVTADVTLTAVWNATVENVLYSWESPDGTAVEVGGTAITKDQDGNTVEGNGNVNATLTNVTVAYKAIMLNGKISSNAWSGNYIQITTDEAVKAGDKVKVTACTTKGDTSKKGSAQMRAGTSATSTAIFTDGNSYNDILADGTLSPNTKTFTVPDGVNTSTLTMTRSQSSTNCWVTKLQIIREVLVEEANIRTVTFNYNDGGATASTSVEVASGSKVSAPADPTYAHHRFHEWQLGGVAYDFATAVTADITLVADWTQLYTISFANGGGSGDAPAAIADKAKDETFEVPANTFTAPEGKEFDKWNDGSADYAPGVTYTVGTANVVLTAQWKAASAKYTVIFKDGDDVLDTKLFEVGSNPSDAGIDKTKALNTFAAWQKEGVDIALDDAFWATVAKDATVTLTARWAKAYAESIDMEQFVLDNTKAGNWQAYLDGKGYIYSQGNASLDSLDNSSGKVKNNYQFLGLKFANNSTDKYVSGNLQAGKLMIVKVGQVGNVHMKLDGVAQDEPAIISGVAADSAAAYTYWYAATDKLFSFYKVSGATTVLKAITITDPYTVTFNANGGEDVASMNGTPSVTLPTPVNATAIFKGWYDAETEGNKIGNAGDSYTPTANITLHAQWETVSSDNTLSALEVDGVALPDFDPEKHIYNIVCEYGHTPQITLATATAEAQGATVAISNDPVHYVDADNDFWYVQANVTPASGTPIGYNQVRYTNKPKQGATIFKAELTAANDADYSGMYADGDNSEIKLADDGANGYKFSGTSNYVKMAIADATFAEGDMLKMTYTTNPQQGELAIYDGTTKLQGTAYSNHILTFSDAVGDDKSTLFIRRTNDNNFNGWVAEVEVQRYMAPIIKSYKIGAVSGTIDQDLKTIAIELPYGTTLSGVAATIEAYANGGATVIAPTPLAYDTPLGYKVSSAYAEDGDVDYTVTITEAEASHEATLSDIKLDGVSLEGFDPATLSYNVELEKGTLAYPTVTYTAATGATVVPNSETFPGAYNLVVTAEDGTTENTYTINFTVSTKDKVVIFDGSTMDAIATSPDVTTGLSWLKTGDMSVESKTAPAAAAKAYTKAIQIGSTGSSKNFKVVVPNKYTAQFFLAHNSNGDAERTVYIDTEYGQAPKDGIYNVANTKSDIAEGKSSTVGAGTYYINVSGGTVNIYEISVYLDRVSETPAISAQPTNLAVCAINTDTLSVTASVEAGTLSYQWYKVVDEGDDEAVGTNSNEYVPAAVGQYYVVVANTEGSYTPSSKKSDVVTVSLKPATEITSAPSTQRGAVDAVVTLSVEAADATNYAWYTCDENGDNAVAVEGASGATKTSIQVTITEDMRQYYKVVVTGECGTDEAIALVEEWSEVAQANVTGYQKWDWNVTSNAAAWAGVANILLTDDDKTTDFIMANTSSTMPNNTHFRSDMLITNGEYPARPTQDGGVFQGYAVKFHTTVPGKVTVVYRGTGGSVKVNLKINDWTPGETSDWKTKNVVVPAGDVVITDVNSAVLRIRSIEFDPALNPEDAEASTLGGYTRSVTEGRYGTICLENGGIMVGATLYEVAYYGETSKKIFFDEILNGEMEAGVPYIYLPNEDADELAVFYTDEANESAKSANGLVGYIGASEDAADALAVPHNEGNYILNNNQYREVVYANSAYILSHRAYIKLAAINPTEPALAPGRRRISMNVQQAEVATGMDNLYNGEQPMKVLIDGQMYILRGEKMYDATGRLVK